MGIFLNNCWIMLFFRLVEHIIHNIALFHIIYPVNFKTSRTPFTFKPSPFPLLSSDLLIIYQGALGRMTTVRVLLGANLSKALHNTSSYSFANDSILCEIHPSDKPDDPIISLKASKSNPFNLRETTGWFVFWPFSVPGDCGLDWSIHTSCYSSRKGQKFIFAHDVYLF